MKHLPAILTLGLLGLPGLCLAQGETKEPQKTRADKTTAQWIEQLGNESYKARLDAEGALKEQGDKALPALKEAAENSKDPEVQWRARRLVRQLEHSPEQGLRQRPQAETPPAQPPAPGNGRQPFQWQQFPGMNDLDSRFDDLFRQLERDFHMDIPRHRFFQDDFFKDLQSQMEEMQKGMGQGGGAFRGQGMTMQMGPGGVRVEVKTKNDKGEDETKVYEAPDMEAFRQKYPGVLEQNGIGNFGFRMAQPFGGWRALPQGQGRGNVQQPDLTLPGDGDATPPPENVRLGVQVKPEISAEVRAFLDLPEGKGLQVENVQDGTLAERLGLKAGDIVLQIGNRDIAGIPDVQEALRPIEAGQTVKVLVNRHGKELTLSAEKTASAAKDSGKLESRSKKGKKEKKEAGGEIK